jgi:hypothetical protein
MRDDQITQVSMRVDRCCMAIIEHKEARKRARDIPPELCGVPAI